MTKPFGMAGASRERESTATPSGRLPSPLSDLRTATPLRDDPRRESRAPAEECPPPTPSLLSVAFLKSSAASVVSQQSPSAWPWPCEKEDLRHRPVVASVASPTICHSRGGGNLDLCGFLRRSPKGFGSRDHGQLFIPARLIAVGADCIGDPKGILEVNSSNSLTLLLPFLCASAPLRWMFLPCRLHGKYAPFMGADAPSMGNLRPSWSRVSGPSGGRDRGRGGRRRGRRRRWRRAGSRCRLRRRPAAGSCGCPG